mmetsp:Transcript_6289/g.22101  ORF Transcript_6289/g.22101 Transcript_6289/m.22101 type:complete len:219 (-) Transcript_6289:2285-2941(-)
MYATQVALTEVRQKEPRSREGLLELLNLAILDYRRIYVVRFFNLRNQTQKQLRDNLKKRALTFFGNNRVLAKALGRIAKESKLAAIDQIAARIRGTVGLIFSDMDVDELQITLSQYEVPEYAHVGSIAADTVEIPAGPLHGVNGILAQTLEPIVRKQGLPTRQHQGTVELTKNYKVCTVGDQLNAQQACLLRVLGYKLETFRTSIDSIWENGRIKVME